MARLPRPPRSRWTSFVPGGRGLHEQANPAHRARIEHNRDTLLVHLSDEGGDGRITLAVDRATRRHAIGEARTQRVAARVAFDALYVPDDARDARPGG